MTPLVFAASAASGGVVAVVAWLVVGPTRPLSSRVMEYSPEARSRLGLKVGTGRVEEWGPAGLRVFAPMFLGMARGLSALVDAESEQVMLLRLRQAGMLTDVDPQRRVASYRLRQLRLAGMGLVVGVFLGVVLGLSLAGVASVGVLGLVVGGTKLRGTVDKAISRRRERMLLEIYTLDQLLALRIRAGGGVMGALEELSSRGRGEVVGEIVEALRAIRAGDTPVDAFERLAVATPEPHCARTYFLLAQAQEHGSDLAEALLSLANDVRSDRREALRRQAVKRRAAMLIPTIGLMAPVMLLFIVAPLPRIIFGGL